MQKLYKIDSGIIMAYHEAWIQDDSVVEHWGALGSAGESRTTRRRTQLSEEEEIASLLGSAREKGYEPIDIDDHSVLIIEYEVEGMGSAVDLDKREALQDRMDEVLGWTGLGHCDGGSIGSGTMEVCCIVVDFATAKACIEDDLRGTGFGDYFRIYDEDED